MSFKDKMVADLASVFFNEEHFAEPATYLSRLGVSTSLAVIFDAKYSEIGFEETKVQTREIVAWARESAMPPLYDKDTKAKLVVRGTTFQIISAQPDGAGLVDLVLHRA